MPLFPEAVSANSAVAEQLAALDVCLEADDGPPDWFSIDGIGAPRQVGGDGAGGAFVLLPSNHVL